MNSLKYFVINIQFSVCGRTQDIIVSADEVQRGKWLQDQYLKTLAVITLTLEGIITNNESFIKVIGLEKTQAWSVA